MNNIIVQYAILWGQTLGSALTTKERAQAKEMKNWDSEELLQIFTRWADEYMQSDVEDSVEFFETKLSELLQGDFSVPCTKEKKEIKKLIKIKNTYGTETKYVLIEEYGGFGVYQEKTPSGYFASQSWLISNNENAELVIESYNNLCKEELLEIIDNFNKNGKFGVKAVMHCDSLHMHISGKMV